MCPRLGKEASLSGKNLDCWIQFQLIGNLQNLGAVSPCLPVRGCYSVADRRQHIAAGNQARRKQNTAILSRETAAASRLRSLGILLSPFPGPGFSGHNLLQAWCSQLYAVGTPCLVMQGSQMIPNWPINEWSPPWGNETGIQFFPSIELLPGVWRHDPAFLV